MHNTLKPLRHFLVKFMDTNQYLIKPVAGILAIILIMNLIACDTTQFVNTQNACCNMQEVCAIEYNNFDRCIQQISRQAPDETVLTCLTEADSCGEIRSCYMLSIDAK